MPSLSYRYDHRLLFILSYYFFSIPIISSEVECLRASGPFSIHVNVLHMLKKDISIPSSKISNISMKTETHPDF